MRLVHDAQAREPFAHLGRQHRRAVVGQQRPRQPALQDAPAKPVHEALGRSRPDTTARDSTAASGRRDTPSSSGVTHCPAGGEHRARAVVEVEVPQPVHVRGLVAADLARPQALLGALPPGRGRPRAAAFAQAVARMNRRTVA